MKHMWLAVLSATLFSVSVPFVRAQASFTSYFTDTAGTSGSNSFDMTLLSDETTDGDIVGNASTCHVEVITDATFNGGNTFSAALPGVLTQVSAARDGSVWGVNGGNLPYRLTSGVGSAQNGYSWTQMPLLPNSASINQVSVGSVNNVWAVKAADGSVWQWNGSSWTRKGTNGNIKEVSVSSWDGTVWAVTNANIPLQWNPSTGAWMQMPANLSWVSVAAYNNVWGIGGANKYGGNAWHYNPSTNGYDAHNGTLTRITAYWDANNGTTLYGVNSSNQLWTSYLGGSTANAPWTLLGTATDVSVGSLSDVWQSNSGTLSRYFPTTTESHYAYGTGTQYVSSRAENPLNNMPSFMEFNFAGTGSTTNSCSVPNLVYQASAAENDDEVAGPACGTLLIYNGSVSTPCDGKTTSHGSGSVEPPSDIKYNLVSSITPTTNTQQSLLIDLVGQPYNHSYGCGTYEECFLQDLIGEKNQGSQGIIDWTWKIYCDTADPDITYVTHEQFSCQ